MNILRVKVPENWTISQTGTPREDASLINRIDGGTSSDTQLTLAELNARLKPMFDRVLANEAANCQRWMEDMKFWGWKPPTRWQKFRGMMRAAREWLGRKIGGLPEDRY